MRRRSLADLRREAIIRELGEHRARTVDELTTAILDPRHMDEALAKDENLTEEQYRQRLRDSVGHLLPQMRKAGVVESREIDKVHTNTWKLTPKGARDALAGHLIEAPVVLHVPEGIVGGTYTVHHERENEVGQKIRDLAWARGDLARWDNEVRLPMAKPMAIADLVVQYERRFPDGSLLKNLLIEIDRGMGYRYPAHKLIAKLYNYNEVRKAPDVWPVTWRKEFPPLLVVMDGEKVPDEELRRRIRTVSGIWTNEYDSRLQVRFVLLNDLMNWTPDDLPPLFDDPREEGLAS